MKPHRQPVSETAIQQAIETLGKPFVFGSRDHFEANRLLSKCQPIICRNCDDKATIQDPARGAPTGQRVPCLRCRGRKRGYKASTMFWTGWAKGTTEGVLA